MTKLQIYQSALLASIVLLAVMGFMLLADEEDEAPASRAPSAPPPPAPAPVPPSGPRIRVIDLDRQILAANEEFASMADFVETLFSGSVGTVHTHALGHGQRVPMHIHKQSDEAVVILSGAPEVKQIYGNESGAFANRSTTPALGTVVYSPPWCGHAWLNPNAETMQANLVLAAPPFEGNFYVADDDERMRRGKEPHSYSITDDLKAFEATKAPSSLRDLPFMPGTLKTLFVRTEHALGKDAESATVMLVVSGEGQFQRKDVIALRKNHLMIVPVGWEGSLQAKAGATLALLVFKPGRPL